MATHTVFNIAELVEAILVETDTMDVIQARRVNHFFHATIAASVALKRKLFLAPCGDAQVWEYDTISETVKVATSESSSDNITRINVKASNPLLFQQWAEPESAVELMDILDEIFGPPKRFRQQQLAEDSELGHCKLSMPVYPGHISADSIYRNMVLFKETTSSVTMRYAVGKYRESNGTKVVQASEGSVKLKDLSEALPQIPKLRKSPCWKVDVFTNGDIYPTEGEIAMVQAAEDGLSAK